MNSILFKSPIGTLLLLAHDKGLFYCNWLHPECVSKQEKILALSRQNTEGDGSKILKETATQLDEYFQGLRRIFQLPMVIYGTPFQQKVWHQMFLTDYATTISYVELARKCGCPKAARAVANACGANPLAVIIPCHRIVGSNGKPGGYTGGIEKKQYLLQHETYNSLLI